MIRQWQHLTTNEFAELRDQQAWALLPIASTEQHGPHLPVGTDALILEGILGETQRHLELSAPLLVLPSLHYGKSVEHQQFPGTITLSCYTLLHVLDDIAASLARHGFRRLIVVNSHGGNTALIEGHLQDLRAEYGTEAYLVHISSGEILERAKALFGAYPREQMHADATETTEIYHLHPELVRSAAIPAEQIPVSQGLARLASLAGLAAWGWATGDLSSDGVIGDPQLASREAGETLTGWVVERLSKALRTIIEG